MSGETIPDDIRAAAAHALQADSYHPELVFLIEPVALVILAERERCAALVEAAAASARSHALAVAEEYQEEDAELLLHGALLNRLAAAIRKGEAA